MATPVSGSGFWPRLGSVTGTPFQLELMTRLLTAHLDVKNGLNTIGKALVVANNKLKPMRAAVLAADLAGVEPSPNTFWGDYAIKLSIACDALRRTVPLLDSTHKSPIIQVIKEQVLNDLADFAVFVRLFKEKNPRHFLLRDLQRLEAFIGADR